MRLYRIRIHPKEIPMKIESPPALTVEILAIESLCRVHRHAPGGSHCIVAPDATHIRCSTLRDCTAKKNARFAGLCKHFRALSACIRDRQVTARTRHSRAPAAYTSRCFFLSLRTAMTLHSRRVSELTNHLSTVPEFSNA